MVVKENDSARVLFQTKEARDSFFRSLKKMFVTWRSITESFDVSESQLRRYRKGEATLPHFLFNRLLHEFDDNDERYYRSHICLKDSVWGQRKGGRMAYRNHPENLAKGRRKARNQEAEYSFPTDVELTPELCELIGAFIGDGFTNVYESSYTVQFTGDREQDKDYFDTVLKEILLEINDGLNPLLKERGNALRLNVYSKELHRFFVERLGFPLGEKVYDVRIPDEILKLPETHINACIRGVFDTDGGVYFDKRDVYERPYVRIGLHMESSNLISQVYDILSCRGIRTSITSNKKKLQINGEEECRQFMDKIGFSNNRHLEKLSVLM